MNVTGWRVNFYSSKIKKDNKNNTHYKYCSIRLLLCEICADFNDTLTDDKT